MSIVSTRVGGRATDRRAPTAPSRLACRCPADPHPPGPAREGPSDRGAGVRGLSVGRVALTPSGCGIWVHSVPNGLCSAVQGEWVSLPLRRRRRRRRLVSKRHPLDGRRSPPIVVSVLLPTHFFAVVWHRLRLRVTCM